jgi:transposase-like protein
MPRKSKSPNPEQPSVPEIPKEFLDQIVSGPMTAEAVEAVMHKFKKAVIERAVGGEMTHHLGYGPGAPHANDNGNHRNGTSAKKVLTDDGAVRIDVPRDRQGT